MNPLRRAYDRMNEASLARNARALEKSGWPHCVVEGCTEFAWWRAVEHRDRTYCIPHSRTATEPAQRIPIPNAGAAGLM